MYSKEKGLITDLQKLWLFWRHMRQLNKDVRGKQPVKKNYLHMILAVLKSFVLKISDLYTNIISLPEHNLT